MATRVISTSLQLDGEQEFKKELSLVNGELRNLKSDMALMTEEFRGNANSLEALTAKSDLLGREMSQQEEKVRALEQAVREASEVYGDADSRTDKYRQSLNRAKVDLIRMQRELDDTNDLMDEARQSTDQTAHSIDGFGNRVSDAAGALDDLGGDGGGLGKLMAGLSNVKGLLAGGAFAAGLAALKGMSDQIMEIEESTREYRRTMGLLEISSQAAGYTAAETEAAYTRLYRVLGDSQTTATTLANLQAIGMSQEDLLRIIDQSVGAWSAYGDSIPIDGLAESVNETIRAGEVTGTLADVLNWGSQAGETFGVQLKANTEANAEFNKAVSEAKTAEDFFNIALSECKTEAEKADLVMRAMSDQGLADVAQAYYDTHQEIGDAMEAQKNWEEAMAGLGETLAPIATDIKNFGAESIVWLTGVLDEGIQKIKDFMAWAKKMNDKLNETGVTAEDAKRNNPSLYDDKPRNQHGSYAGSHAGGLDRVPYDDYLANLHKDEAVLTAREASVWRTFQRLPQSQTVGGGASTEVLTAAVVNGINMSGLNSGPSGVFRGELTLRTEDGQILGRYMVPFVRSEDKSNPEVRSDLM